MTDVVIRRVGMHPFGRFDDKSTLELGAAAVNEALADAGGFERPFQTAGPASV